MAFIDHKTKTVNFKIVYHGPGLAGKTTNMYYIYDMAKPDTKGKLMSLATETDRAVFFDFSPYGMPKIRGYEMRFHLYTVPG